MRISKQTFEAMPTELRALFRQSPNEGRAEVVGLFPETGVITGGTGEASRRPAQSDPVAFSRSAGRSATGGFADSGSAARFFPALPRLPIDDEAERLFYTAKASTAERGEDNTHATVKPVELMRWLVRLVTPPDGTVLDCFLGSGTTGVAARLEGFRFIGIEREPEYMAIAEQRMGADYGAVPRVVSKPKENAVQPSLFAAVQAPGRAK